MPKLAALNALILLLFAATARAEPFSFVALGDTAYNGERDYPVYRALIDIINRSQPAFTIHVGDVWGVAPCSDEHLTRIDGFFALYDQPVIYTPGDNEWADCWHRVMGGHDPIERLQRLRALFFKDKWSLGKTKLNLVRQSAVSRYKLYAENARWAKDDVLFFTVHVPGSSNGYRLDDLGRLSEAVRRTEANVAFIRDSFRIAREQDFKAVVMAFHAELFDLPKPQAGPFGAIVDETRRAADRYQRPILLIHGDKHEFKIDRPLLEPRGESDGPLHANVTRLQVYGAPEIKAVRVSVDTSTPWVFSFSPLYVGPP